MAGFLLRLGIGMAGLWVASRLVPGMHIEGTGTLVLAAFLLGFVNAVVRPVLVLLTLPVTLVTLGLFLLVVNAAMLALVAALLDGFQLAGFGSAVLGLHLQKSFRLHHENRFLNAGQENVHGRQRFSQNPVPRDPTRLRVRIRKRHIQ